jgi:hypothetical protein
MDWVVPSVMSQVAEMLRASGEHSLRKRRLFAVALTQHVCTLLSEGPVKVAAESAIEMGYQWADDNKSTRERLIYSYDLRQATNAFLSTMGKSYSLEEQTLNSVRAATCDFEGPGGGLQTVCNLVLHTMVSYSQEQHDPDRRDPEVGEYAEQQEYEHQYTIGRDIFGNPFRPVAFEPDWRTGTVVSLARGMYDSRDFSPMPILADALQDAGCEHADILAHCRGDGPHVRGCWVVDLVLGKG